MAVDKGDLSRLLQYRRTQELQSPTENDSTESVEKTSEKTSSAKVGRPTGRRSDPNTENTTLILNKRLKAEVIYKLSLQNIERSPGHKTSLSDLVEELLYSWNQTH